MALRELKIGASGVRGVVGEALTPAMAAGGLVVLAGTALASGVVRLPMRRAA